MQIHDITNILTKNFNVNTQTQNTWSLFVNHIYQYKNEYYKIKCYNNKSLLLDFHKRSMNILRTTNDIINNIDLDDKKIEYELKYYVNSLIESFLKFNIEELKSNR
jgi:hypothetical protein